MKKIVIVLFFVVIICSLRKNEVVIPDDSIRFRIIASSNDRQMQELKWKIANELAPLVNNIKGDTLEEKRVNIENNLDKIDEIIEKYTDDYKITYGLQKFPKKSFINRDYDEGYYEALIVSLGEARGNNFWCVVFPPMCLINFDNDDAVKYTTIFSEIVEKYRK